MSILSDLRVYTPVASRLSGTGHYLPEQVLSNQELAKTVDTSDEWIVRRTGIRQRHIAAKDQRTSDLAIEAARRAIAAANIAATDINLVVLATTTPDHTFPATATKVAHVLGIKGAAFDIQAVCAGFIFALSQADMAIKLGKAQKALVIGAEVYSRILDWQDRSTCVLFGDGAGAVVLEATNAENPRRILDTELKSDGAYYHDLFADGGPHDGQSGVVKMAGREVYRQAIVQMADVVSLLLQCNNLSLGDLDWLIPHQANIRIMQQIGQRLNLPEERVVATVADHANISAATIPTALDVAVCDGRIQTGHLLGLTALGGGFSWGGALIRF
ncbi:MAG: ketoacyl-ACP synthase III [Alphaproteobacteria bacterium]|nr:ketoacyl-ACP synthase III [Alphaproteobacteria bacterium]